MIINIKLYKTMRMKFFTLIIGLMTALGAAAQNSGTTGPLKWNYDASTKTLSITGTGAMPDFFTSDDQPWKTFRSKIKKVTIGDGVTTVGSNAFREFSQLQNITLPNSLTTIGRGAFTYCKALQNITLPNTLIMIENNTFNSCSALQSITLPNTLTTIGMDAFVGCLALQSITLPKSVTTIRESAFASCQALKSVTVAWDTPLAIKPDVFGQVTLSGVTLKVPKGTKAKYQAAPVWKDFKINETTANQTIDGLRVYAADGALHLTLPKAEKVHIYHVSGAMVKTLVLPAGDHVQPLPSGVYVVCVGERVTKILIK